MFDRDTILAEIRRTAEENGGRPLGEDRFAKETGIRPRDWSGRYWARWSDALLEAGLTPNDKNVRLSDETVFEPLIRLIRELGRLPTDRERQLLRRQDKSFPSERVFRRFGRRRDLALALVAYCRERSEFDDIEPLIAPLIADEGEYGDKPRGSQTVAGYVYLLKSGRFYKIGRTNAAGRRERELAIQLPERATRLHTIKTDDPVGIERYWHTRFADRRVRADAEWFDLTREDVAAFRRRTFQ